MKYNRIIILSVILLSSILFSCSDYLDVQPEDKYLQDQVFGSEDGINNVLNGVYLSMSDPATYGGNLTMNFVEILGQRYNLSDSRHKYYSYSRYEYNEGVVKSTVEDIWNETYATILNINNLLSGLDEQSVLTKPKTDLIKGESYGLRAMLHFDLLRLFGPIYSEDPTGLSIPYYKEAKAESNPLLSAQDVVALVLEDLNKAEEFLMDDIISDNGVEGDPDNPFYQRRNLRMNYYAVKGLQARVNLYAGNNEMALIAAKTVIDQVDKFPWTKPTDVISGANPDRVFSSEILFAVENLNLYNQQRKLFASELQDFDILAPNNVRLGQTFENNENDYRYNSSWAIPAVGSKTYRTFFKFEDIPNKAAEYRFLQPLLRMTEMYYIAAEATNDPSESLQYLNTVRYNRGLIDLTAESSIEDEIKKEYMKEFFGEGQLFFYYKRKSMGRIPNGSSPSASAMITMDASKYIVPLPDSEAQFIN